MEVREPSARYLTDDGTQRTEIGALPKDWSVVPLTLLAEKIMVGIASAATHAYRSTGVPMFRNQNIRPGLLDTQDVLYIDPQYEQTYKNKRLKAGDLLTARTGYPGTTSLVPAGLDGAQSFTTLITRPRPGSIDPQYLCLYINGRAGQRYFEQAQIGGGQKNVNAASLKLLPVALPSTDTEQRAIARALIDADGLIHALEQLLTKKRQIKLGAMQELLTGKRRLPGFVKRWNEVKLRQLGNFLKGSGIKREEALSGDLPCVRYGEIYTTHSDYIRRFSSWISPAVASSATLLHQGDLLFAGSGETKVEIGKCVAFLEERPAYAGGDIVILRPTVDADSMYLGYLLNTPGAARQKASKGQGDAVVHISANSLGEVEVVLPEPSEQAAIAKVLFDIDGELADLEARLTKARALKQGMAQALLTGRIRLVEPTQ